MSLSALAPELIQHIAYHAAADYPGPPAALAALQCTCRALHAALDPANAPYLHARIFRAKFDHAAPARRLGSHVRRASVQAVELRRRCALLRRVRSKDVHGPHVHHDLWYAYLMMLENDGRNARQLVLWANVFEFALVFLKERMYEGCETNNGWPLETESTALSVWLLWLASDEESICNEPVDVRNFIIDALQPFVVAPFKYQPLLIPDAHYMLPLMGSPTTNPPSFIATQHGPFPIYRPLQSAPRLMHFGVSLTVCAPPLTPAALLCVHTRLQVSTMQPPSRLPERRSMLPPNVYGVTLEDYEEVNTNTLTKCVSWGSERHLVSFLDDDNDDDVMEVDGDSSVSITMGRVPPASVQHGYEWMRITNCFDPWLDLCLKVRAFTPGMLNGLWSGRLFVFDGRQHAEISQHSTIHSRLARRLADSCHHTPDKATSNLGYGTATDAGAFPAAYQMPIFMRLREHHCMPEALPTRCAIDAHKDADVDGLGRAWFAPECEFEERDGELHILDTLIDEETIYETYEPGRPNSHVAAGGCVKCNPDADIGRGISLQSPHSLRSVQSNQRSRSSCPSASTSTYSTSFDDAAESRLSYPTHPSYAWNTIFPAPSDADLEIEELFRKNGVDHPEVDASEEGSGDEEGWVDDVADGCVTDIVITGETDFDHGRAWGFYKFIGRIRDADGLVILLRFPVSVHSQYNPGLYPSDLHPPFLSSLRAS
ncbi:hypothetical protein EW145_g3270 [Phellinidium pouzarii]|uniref:F-box domain-containing protein n=1 Tax=Phellinidium pouzarii TaxID=167371 RepID=A0A4S4L882_9AGAM|nr:hypothetical protein EW145_g3270 [Phellinidium pouzarii]